MKIVAFDTETIGFPEKTKSRKYYNYKNSKKYDSSRIVQFGAVIYEESKEGEFELIDKIEFIIKPDGFEICNDDIHGISTERAVKEGISTEEFVSKISEVFNSADLIISHNFEFDKNILLSELYRNKAVKVIKMIESTPCFCTCISTTEIVKIPTSWGRGYKWPSLAELYRFVFSADTDPEKKHNALYDSMITAQCFFSLYNDNKISPF